jgi:hypothetical protein
MARPAAIDSPSLLDLEQTIRQRRRDLQKLERKRAKVQRKLDQLDRKTTSLAGSALGGRRGGRGSRPRNESSLSEAIAQVLLKAGGAMNVGEIAEKVQAGGYRSGSANFRSIVNQRLVGEKRFKNAGRGMYQLDTAAGTSKVQKTRRKVQRKK